MEPCYHCPIDCDHREVLNEDWDNPEIGECTIEDKRPAGQYLEDSALELCHRYGKTYKE